MTTRFVLIRHGRADYELAQRRRLRGLGRDLVPLTREGVREIERLAHAPPRPIDVLVSSPMTRALQSAAILAGRWRVPLHVEFDLHEWLPDRTGTYDDVAVVGRARQAYLRHGGEWPEGVAQGWEPRSRLVERVGAVLARYGEGPARAVGVVCHGAVIEALTGREVATGGWIEHRPGPPAAHAVRGEGQGSRAR